MARGYPYPRELRRERSHMQRPEPRNPQSVAQSHRGWGAHPLAPRPHPGAAGPRGWGLTTQPSALGGDGEAPPQGRPVPLPPGASVSITSQDTNCT